jgi:SWI/SNF-related matrix-associated actin-dependent regulator of chromatin subfamily A-like protein 1
MEINTLLQRPLFPYQIEGVQKGIAFGSYINGDEPGLGKTSQAIADVVVNDSWPVIVICPSTLKENWRNEFNIVAGIDALVLTDKYIQSWPQYYEAGYFKAFIVNYESVRKFFVESAIKQHGGKLIDKDIKYRAECAIIKACIIDEIHRCREPKTAVSKLVNGLTNHIPKVIGLTGTPVVNKAQDLAQQLKIINRLDYFGGENGIKQYTGKGGDLEQLHYMLNDHCFFQRKKKDVLHDLPETPIINLRN